MRHTPKFLTIAAATLAAAALAACSGSGSDARTSSPSSSSADGASDGIESISYESSLMSVARAYAFKVEGTDCYTTLSSVAEWPRKIGSADIKSLTDTIIAAAYPSQKGKDIKTAMLGFLADTTGVVSGPATVIDPNKVPATTTAGLVHTYIAREALTSSYVTFTVTTMSYAGGAHPVTAVTPISYDLKTSTVVTPAYIFKPGSATIVRAITGNLAMNLGVDPTDLTSAGLTTNTLPMPRSMAIDPNGMLVFQYGQYEIAPYSMGIISVPVTPYQLRDVMTPAGLALFGLTAQTTE